ncbi:MAG: hypothetical protein JO140_03205 [Candidatus Eremiobacteraeota bacterium]|nr:hypothetical protein [Candidatus Eremiobacteraeota bacterium]
MARTVRDAVRPFAAPDEKDAIVHVTIARFRTAVRLPQIPFAEQTMRVEGFSLFESLPGETTTRYEVLETFSLTSHASSPARSK